VNRKEKEINILRKEVIKLKSFSDENIAVLYDAEVKYRSVVDD